MEGACQCTDIHINHIHTREALGTCEAEGKQEVTEIWRYKPCILLRAVAQREVLNLVLVYLVVNYNHTTYSYPMRVSRDKGEHTDIRSCISAIEKASYVFSLIQRVVWRDTVSSREAVEEREYGQLSRSVLVEC